MKKLTLLALSLASASLWANETAKPTNTEAKPPRAVFQVIETDGKVARAVQGNQVSISKKQELCWTVVDLPFKPSNQVTEEFLTPKGAKFAAQGSSVINSEENGLNKSKITSASMKAVNNEFLRRCWKFDKNDPTGHYQIALQVNDTLFEPAYKFEVIK